MSLDRPKGRIRRFWIGLRIGTLGFWILSTVPLMTLCELIAQFILRVDKWLGFEDPEILGEIQERDPADFE